MCKIQVIRYTCGHTHQVRLSTCLGKFVVNQRTDSLFEPYQLQTRCRSDCPTIKLIADHVCGPCSREDPEAEIEAAFQDAIDTASAAAGGENQEAIAEAEAEHGAKLYELHARFPGSWGTRARPHRTLRDLTRERKAVKSGLGNEVLCEDAVGGAGGWDEFATDWSKSAWATDNGEGGEGGEWKADDRKLKGGYAAAEIEWEGCEDCEAAAEDDEGWSDDDDGSWPTTDADDEEVCTDDDEEDATDDEDSNADETNQVNTSNDEHVTPLSSPTIIETITAATSPPKTESLPTPILKQLSITPAATEIAFPTPPPTPTQAHKLDRLETRLHEAKLAELLLERLHSCSELQGLAVVIRT